MIIQRGICPECGEERQLTKAGVMRAHRGDTYVGGWRQNCSGTGQPATSIVADPIAAAEARGYARAIAIRRDEGICGDESSTHAFNCSNTLAVICHLRFGHRSRWHESETGQRWKYHTDDPVAAAESRGRTAGYAEAVAQLRARADQLEIGSAPGNLVPKVCRDAADYLEASTPGPTDQIITYRVERHYGAA